MSSDIRWRKSSHSGDQYGDCVEIAQFTATQWMKSSHSGDQGGQCVEVAQVSTAQWLKSARSSGEGGDCVEVTGVECACAEHASVIAFRDSKDPAGPVLAFGPAAWRKLSGRIKAGGFDVRDA
ncbi:DUF397 domain-containing protein [Actinomadura sp. 9N407]|uniref:DUF397 domain-containing protein n=1 Tax=Actinomadura sp. 9N407 TaxID=3375154 RepID=UPI0037AFC4E3